ncbi:hypothetical protein KFE25_007959 [Diacronema lutheri]|uniref:Uncharacterized protein n=1 Tax=Diacronema lutheri TaxID=2081491 RepID=A0A8J6CE59_DIALT|nr:hypothetical protein KFE25_007959 [Diacronema lutheri]
MPVAFFDTLPLELQLRSKVAERQSAEVEALRRARDACEPAERAALDGDWIGIGGKLGDAAEQARRAVLEQSPPADGTQAAVDAATLRAEVSAQHAQTRHVFETRKGKGLRHLDARQPHCRIIAPVVIARATPEELAEMVRKRLDRLGSSIPKRSHPSTRQAERRLHRLVHFCRANELADKEDYHAAIADYNVSLAVVPDDAFALVNRGNCHKALRSWGAAMADYSAAIAHAPVATSGGRRAPSAQRLLAYAHNNLGAVHHDLADYVSAFAEYTTALAHNPACHITWKNRAHIYALTAQPSPDPQRPPPQHKLIFSDCLTAMDQEWHEEAGFARGAVELAVEVRKIGATCVAYFVVDLVRLPARAT